ncbi:MAG: nuclear transport factor 2 family protein [Thermoplasmata archaeon]
MPRSAPKAARRRPRTPRPRPASAALAWEAHTNAEFAAHDVDATMRTMTARPHNLHLPTLAGGATRAEIRAFYTDHFIPCLPDDIRLDLLSRTVTPDRVVDEFILEFTHDRVMDFIFPGIAPTGRPVSLPTVAIVGVKDGRVDYEHIYWDQASALRQIGKLDAPGLPVVGAEASERLRRLLRPRRSRACRAR